MRVAAFCTTGIILIAASLSATAAATTHTSAGVLTGSTKIYSACPVPSDLCKRWSPYPRARFTVERLSAGGTPMAGTRRIVVSDREARFRIKLRVGSYLVDPIRRGFSKAGFSLRLSLKPRATKMIIVRFVSLRRF